MISRSYLLFTSNKTFLGVNSFSIRGFSLFQHWIWENSDISSDSQWKNNYYILEIWHFSVYTRNLKIESCNQFVIATKNASTTFFRLEITNFLLVFRKIRFYMKNGDLWSSVGIFNKVLLLSRFFSLFRHRLCTFYPKINKFRRNLCFYHKKLGWFRFWSNLTFD